MEGAARSLERDDTGFVALTALRAAARGLTSPEFAAVYPHPALLPLAREPGARTGSSDEARRELSYRRTMISSSDTPRPETSEVVLGYADRVAILAKRPGNPFPKMISVGRAMSNDVVFLLETVSKLQGYFTREDGGAAPIWRFTDQHSSNGTLVNATALEPGRPHALADGDRIRLGLEVEVVFLTAAALHERLLAPVAR